MENLVIAWGNGTGAGLDVDGSARVTLSSTDLTLNHGEYGGGVWINAGSVVTATNGSNLTLNTASSDGGGGRVWGAMYAAGGNEDITTNCAANGGGFSVPGGVLNLNDADLYANTAAGANGVGGAVHVSSSGSVTFTSLVYVGYSGSLGNTAYDGGGIYADASTIHLNDSGVTFLQQPGSALRRRPIPGERQCASWARPADWIGGSRHRRQSSAVSEQASMP